MTHLEQLLLFSTSFAIVIFLALPQGALTRRRRIPYNNPLPRQCPVQKAFDDATMDSTRMLQNLNFSDSNWTLSNDRFWNSEFENRFQKLKNTTERLPLKLIIIPHSHNDAGWGMTIEEYFDQRTKNILDNAMVKLIEHKNMTFLWNEASFLKLWWESAKLTQKQAFKRLVKEGRLEITTGGWIMADEAVNDLYALLDQLIEGQHWFKAHLDVLPITSWAIDPFGVGSTFPYLLKNCGIDSMLFLRMHYAWKKWLAKTQKGDFNWVQRWDSEQKISILSHQAFYEMYEISTTLGPHRKIGRKFDFTTSSGIDESNIESMSEMLLDEAGRTASLFEHNVAHALVGGDFAFQHGIHWDSVYKNYMKLIEFINSNKAKYNNAEVSFGTPSDYFKVIRERQKKFPTFTGDFFVYSDNVKPEGGRPAYWSGYYSTRPYWKQLHRETENAVRSAEILFTIANAISEVTVTRNMEFKAESLYPLLQSARQNLAIFSHHDGSTGTSDRFVMQDFGYKLIQAIDNSWKIQAAAASLLLKDTLGHKMKLLPSSTIPDYFQQYWEKGTFLDYGTSAVKRIVLFNSLGWKRKHYVKLLINTYYVEVTDDVGKPILSQLNPVIELDPSEEPSTRISDLVWELVFLAPLPSLSLCTFTITKVQVQSENSAQPSSVYNNIENDEIQQQFLFNVNGIVALENNQFFIHNKEVTLSFDVETGFLRSMKRNGSDMEIQTTLGFGAYNSVEGHSGPYLFMPKLDQDMKVPISGNPTIYKIEGQITSEVIVFHNPIIQSVHILHDVEDVQQNAVFVENNIDTGITLGEYFMRIDTNINSTTTIHSKEEKVETFYTDQNGYTIEKRLKVESIGIEGNYYPVTSMAYIEDESTNWRLSLLVDRAQGVSSFVLGRLETMIERRVMFDDDRGIGQGVVDNRMTVSNYILTLENISKRSTGSISTPTINAHHLSQALSYPPSLFYIDVSPDVVLTNKAYFNILNKQLPCDSHIINLRTMSDSNNPQLPTKEALFIIQKLAYSCNTDIDISSGCNNLVTGAAFVSGTKFNDNIRVKSVRRTDLTGLRNYSSIYSKVSDFILTLDDVKLNAFEITTIGVKF